MIILDETDKDITYLIDSLGTVTIEKDELFNRLSNNPTFVLNDDERTADGTKVYKLPDGHICTVDKDLFISIKEIIIRHLMLKKYNPPKTIYNNTYKTIQKTTQKNAQKNAQRHTQKTHSKKTK